MGSESSETSDGLGRQLDASSERDRFELALMANEACRPGGSYEIGGVLYRLSPPETDPDGLLKNPRIERAPCDAFGEAFGHEKFLLRAENIVISEETEEVVFPKSAFEHVSPLAKCDFGVGASRRVPSETSFEKESPVGTTTSAGAANTRLISVAPFHLDGGFVHIIEASLLLEEGAVVIASSITSSGGTREPMLSCTSKDFLGHGGMGSVLQCRMSPSFAELVGSSKNPKEAENMVGSSKNPKEAENMVIKFQPLNSQNDFLRARELT